MSQTMRADELVPHQSNSYFFDDIAGEAWQEFVKSVMTSGIIEPLVISQDKVIVSGHQRLRAARELGIESVPVEVRIYDSEDELIKQLIETNIRQRGLGNGNPVKLGRCLKKLEEIEGIAHGGDRGAKPQNAVLKTQADLARELGISVDKIQRYKALAEATPTLQEILEEGKITVTSALKILRSLPEDEQEKVSQQIWEQKEKVSGRDVESLIKRAQKAEEEGASLKAMMYALQAENEALRNREPEREKIPDDYEQLKADNETLLARVEQAEANATGEAVMRGIAEDEKEELEAENRKLREQANSMRTAIAFVSAARNLLALSTKIDNAAFERMSEEDLEDLQKGVEELGTVVDWLQEGLDATWERRRGGDDD